MKKMQTRQIQVSLLNVFFSILYFEFKYKIVQGYIKETQETQYFFDH